MITGMAALQAALTRASTVGTVGAVGEFLREEAAVIADAAAAKLGTYQGAVGPFTDWAELADATKTERVRLGYTENDPLRRDGTLQSHIVPLDHGMSWAKAGIDAADPLHVVGITQELGSVTKNVPPRPYLGPAVWQRAPAFYAKATQVIMAHILGRSIP